MASSLQERLSSFGLSASAFVLGQLPAKLCTVLSVPWVPGCSAPPADRGTHTPHSLMGGHTSPVQRPPAGPLRGSLALLLLLLLLPVLVAGFLFSSPQELPSSTVAEADSLPGPQLTFVGEGTRGATGEVREGVGITGATSGV